MSEATAQQQERSFWGRSGSNRPDAGRSDTARSDPQDAAAQLYAEARTDLDGGQYASAQRRLEVLVARYPASPLADVARKDLQRLYTGTFGSGQQATTMPATRSIQILPTQPPPPQPPLAPVAIQPPSQPVGPAQTSGQTSGQTQGQSPAAALLREASEDFRHLAGDRIFFAEGSADLGGRAKVALEAQATWLTRFPGVEIVIEGHGDDHGSREFNRTIAEKRAQAVKLRLADLGVSSTRMSIVTFGRDRPVADCAEAHCTAQNRRVVTVIERVPPGLTFDITRGPERSAGVPIR